MNVYLTLAKQAETEAVVQKSRFIAFAAPVTSAELALQTIDEIKKGSRDASHHCFAYIIGANKGIQRYSDDGEPSGTAGKPIIEVMIAKDIVDCVVVVTRYFGGMLLGAGGLTRAYAHAASQAIHAAGICAMHETLRFCMDIPYPLWDRVEHSFGSLPVLVENTQYSDTVSVTLLCKAEDESHVTGELVRISDGRLSPQQMEDPFFHPWTV